MLSYEEFKSAVMQELPKNLPGELGDTKVIETIVYDINTKSEALALEGLSTEMPIIRLPMAYNMYTQSANFKETLEMIEIMLVRERAKAIEREELLSFDKFKEQVVFQFINTEQNKEYLEKLVHRDYLDLSVVYRWVYSPEKQLSIILENDFIQKFEITEEELYELAKVNTRRMFPIYAKDMEKLEVTYLNTSKEDIDLDNVTVRTKVGISNVIRRYGAVMVLYEDVLHDIAQRMDSDLYLMPLSIHEMICSSIEIGQTADELASILFSVNLENQSIEHRLSNQIYLYIKDKREVVQVTHTTHISLDDRKFYDGGLPEISDDKCLLTYDEFKELLEGSIRPFLCDELLFLETTIRQSSSGEDCLYYISKNFKMHVDISELYEIYRGVGTLQEIAIAVSTKLNDGYKKTNDLTIDQNLLRENTIMQLVSSTIDEEALAEKAHRTFLDCHIIYRCILNIDEEEMSHFYVYTDMLEQLQLSEDDLYQHAVKNMCDKFPPVILPVEEAVREGKILPAYKQLQLSSRCNKTIYVVTGGAHGRGASYILSESTLQYLENEYETNFYIIPASAHEVVTVPVDAHSPEALYMLLHIMNSMLSDPDDWLSDNIYCYDIKSKKLDFAVKDVDVNELLLEEPNDRGGNEDEAK